MFTNLLVVVAAGLAAPLVLGFFPRVRLPAIVLEIVLAPSGLGWVKPDVPVSILALVGLAFLLFLSGPGNRHRPPPWTDRDAHSARIRGVICHRDPDRIGLRAGGL